MKVLATRRYPGPAFDELGDVEVRALGELESARPDVEALLVANEPVPVDLLPELKLVAKRQMFLARNAQPNSEGPVYRNTRTLAQS